jgi:hypothetical protein
MTQLSVILLATKNVTSTQYFKHIRNSQQPHLTVTLITSTLKYAYIPCYLFHIITLRPWSSSFTFGSNILTKHIFFLLAFTTIFDSLHIKYLLITTFYFNLTSLSFQNSNYYVHLWPHLRSTSNSYLISHESVIMVNVYIK